MATTALAPVAAQAHTDALGFVITPGTTSGLYNAEIFYGSWHSSGLSAAEGDLVLKLADGTVVGQKTFVLRSSGQPDGTLPAGLVAGVNYFFPNTSTPEQGDLTGTPGGHPIYAFQSVVFTDLAAGSYLFGYAAGSSFTANWQPSDEAINNGSFSITADGQLGEVGGAEPSTPDIDTAQSNYTIDQLGAGQVNAVFAGGTLATGANAEVATNFTINSAGGAIDTSGYDVTVSGVFSDGDGAGSLTKTGDGTLTLTGTNTYSGGTTVSGGTLAGDATSLQGAIVNNANVEFAQGADGTYAGAMSGAGSLIKTGDGTLTLTGTNTYSGGTTVSEGAVIGDTASLQGAIVNNANVEFAQGADGTYAGDMSGAGSLTKTGDGTLTLTGTNTYSGGTTVSEGSVIGNTASLQGAIVNNANVQFNQGATGTYAGVMSGSGSLTKTGDATLVLTGANTYSGGTTVSDGVLVGDTTSLQGAIANNANVVFDQAAAGTYAGAMSGSGVMTKAGDATLTLTGANSQAGLDVVEGRVIVANAGAIGAADGAVNLREGAAFEAGSAMTITQDVNIAGADAVFDTGANRVDMAGTFTGSDCLNKYGSGQLNLTAAGGNAIGACVHEGNLSFNSVFGGNVWVYEGAKASGGGFIQGDVSVRGDLSPGNSPGQLVVEGSVTQSASSSLSLDIDGRAVGAGAGAFDTLVLTGADSVYTAGGQIRPILRGITGAATNTFTPEIGDTFQVVTAQGGVVGSYAALVQPTAGLAENTRFDVRYLANAVVLTVTPASFARFGGAGNAGRFGAALDGFRGAAGVRDDSDAGRLVDGLMGLDGQELARAMQQASGEIHADALDGALYGGRAARASVSDRLTAATPGVGRRVWAKAGQEGGDAETDANARRYEMDTTTYAVGFDQDLSEQLMLGVAVAYNTTKIDTAWVGDADIDGYSGVVYGRYRAGANYLSGVAAYGEDEYEVRRTVDLSTGPRSVVAKPKGDAWSVDLEAGRRIAVAGAELTPALGVAYDDVSRDAVSETGDAVIGLSFGEETRKSLTARLGARLSASVGAGETDVRPYLSAFVTHEFEDTAATLSPRLHGERFDIIAPAADETGLRLGAGVDADIGSRLSLSLGARFETAGGVTRQSVGATAALRW